jgi:early B-cell factor
MAHDSSLSPPMPSEQPAAMEQRPAVVTSQRHYVASAHFEKQPPDNMRKSNFFHFIISLYDSQQHRVKVQKAVFKDFYDIMIEGQEYRNGLIYKLLVVYSDG